MTQEPQSNTNFYPINIYRENEYKNKVVSFQNGKSLLKLEFFVPLVKSVFFNNGEGLNKLQELWKMQNNCYLPFGKERKSGGINDWFGKGIDCEMLEPGKNWKKGKIRFRLILEFAPDEPEPSDPNSTLDDIRKMGHS